MLGVFCGDLFGGHAGSLDANFSHGVPFMLGPLFQPFTLRSCGHSLDFIQWEQSPHRGGFGGSGLGSPNTWMQWTGQAAANRRARRSPRSHEPHTHFASTVLTAPPSPLWIGGALEASPCVSTLLCQPSSTCGSS